jgi:transposase
MENCLFNEEKKNVKCRYFSVEFKQKRVSELEKNLVSIPDICRTYNVSRSAVYKWIYKYSVMAKREVRQVIEIKSDTMKIQMLEQKVRDLERLVGQKQILIEFKDKMIEIAESTYNIDIKKKVGSKLYPGSTATDKSTDIK